ncbi:MAG: hypothetical protein K2L13_03435 [Opitutales bacterium]|nr:hypothetical protein [Opitutales bacterium]
MLRYPSRKKIVRFITILGVFWGLNSTLHGINPADSGQNLVQNFPLVHVSGQNTLDGISADPQFLKILPDIHRLISRSYKSTKRASDRHYLNQHMLEHDEDVTMAGTGHHWHCIKNFQGKQGDFVTTHIGWRLVRQIIRLFSGGYLPNEVDYPGFVAYSTDSDPTGSIIWLAVVLRGSQGENFQPGDGMFGGSWVTNYNAGPSELHKEFYPFTGQAHSGYLNKILSCNISMRNAINAALRKIGQENFSKVRFVVTGHSQGGGLAQVALPIIIHEYGYIYNGKGTFKNSETPRFFGYFMSTPRAICGKDTADAYIKYVGADNMIRHQAYGDVVPMLCLPGYLPVGHLAVDTLYDTICRAIRSETAYCNRYMLFWSIKDLLDPAKFVVDDKSDTWISIANPEFEINWTELCKIVCSQSVLYNMSTEVMFKTFLDNAFLAAHPTKPFETAKKPPELSDAFLVSLLKSRYDLKYVETILRDFSFFKDVSLEEKKIEHIFAINCKFEEQFGNFEKIGVIGAFNNLRLLNNLTTSLNKLGNFEQFINEDLLKIVPKDGIVIDNKITPTGDSSLVAYAHYGSASNFFKSKLFDSNIPSKNLNLSLRNGLELLRSKQNDKEQCVFVYEEALPNVLFNMISSQ